MNRKQKGLKTQRELIKLLEASGWIVSVVERLGRFIKEKDLWNLLDLACIKGNYIKFIQVKSNQWGKITPYKQFAKIHQVPNVYYEIWRRKDRMSKDKRWDSRQFYCVEEI